MGRSRNEHLREKGNWSGKSLNLNKHRTFQSRFHSKLQAKKTRFHAQEQWFTRHLAFQSSPRRGGVDWQRGQPSINQSTTPNTFFGPHRLTAPVRRNSTTFERPAKEHFKEGIQGCRVLPPLRPTPSFIGEQTREGRLHNSALQSKANRDRSETQASSFDPLMHGVDR